ncbi:MAG: hypothetical protein IT210_24815 [Armatimonadetes bacterium]|nr:hypothetical protein [Armatimonadota bacterium]
MTEESYCLAAGVARAVITPPVGVEMAGFAGRGPSVGVHDDLFATVMVAESRGDKAAVVSCDLLYLTAAQVRLIRQEIADRTGILPENIMVACTHTHYGPSTPDPDEEDASPLAHYVRGLRFYIAGAAQRATERMQPVVMGVGRGASEIGINRRERRPDGTIVLGHNPEGVIDREVGVVRLDTPEGEPVAALVNFACHPVAQGWNTREVSADIPGQMRKVMESLTGTACLYLQGGCGNINPKEMEIAWEPARRQGTILGCDAVRVYETIRPGHAEGVDAAGQTIHLPRRAFASRAEADRKVSDLEDELADLRARGLKDEDSAVWWANHRLKRAREMRESLETGVPLPPVSAEMQAVRIGGAVFVSSPGEPFAEIGLEIKSESPWPDTFFVGYANGSIGYIPWPTAYAEGGYEVEHASKVGPEAASQVVDAGRELLEALSKKDRS